MPRLRAVINDSELFEGTLNRSGEPYAVREFKATESNPENPNHPQVAKFSLFKKGEYIKFATTEFPPVGSIVDIEFNLKLKEGVGNNGKAYAINQLQCWSVKTISKGGNSNQPQQPNNHSQFEEDPEDMTF